MIFQEDNDGSHGTRSSENVAAWKKCVYDLDFIDNWPPNSPDLNPIENVWRILKSRVKLHKSMTYQQLRRAIEREWWAITDEEINECILGRKRGPNKGKGGKKGNDCHIQTHIEQAIEREGLSTEF